MFVGISKNLGNGFRIGLGTKLDGSNKISAKELNTQEFKIFLNKVEQDLNNFLLIFIKANNQNYNELVSSKADLDDVFKDNDNYEEFVSILSKTKKDIDKILYTGDTGVVAKRAITESIFTLKEYIDNKYPNIIPDVITKEKAKKPMNKFLKWFLIIFGILMFLSILGQNKEDKNKVDKNIVIEKKQ